MNKNYINLGQYNNRHVIKHVTLKLKLCFEIYQYFMVKVSLFHETLGEEGEMFIYAGAQKSDQVRQLDHKMSLKYLFKLYI